jgi:16S rRNA (guanine527-N7)-methyltransferase
VQPHLDHSRAFAHAVRQPPAQAADLGSGGGIPGLPLALLWPDSRWVLIDANRRRTAFLVEAVGALDLSDRVEVLCQRAEVSGHGLLRGTRDLVVARGFASPAVTAECAAPLLRVGGGLVVSEPPAGMPDRWPPRELEQLGLTPTEALTSPVALQVLRQTDACPPRYPRRTGIPAKRPLW